MIRRPPRSTLSSSSAASDVYKRQERVFERRAAVGPSQSPISSRTTSPPVQRASPVIVSVSPRPNRPSMRIQTEDPPTSPTSDDAEILEERAKNERLEEKVSDLESRILSLTSKVREKESALAVAGATNSNLKSRLESARKTAAAAEAVLERSKANHLQPLLQEAMEEWEKEHSARKTLQAEVLILQQKGEEMKIQLELCQKALSKSQTSAKLSNDAITQEFMEASKATSEALKASLAQNVDLRNRLQTAWQEGTQASVALSGERTQRIALSQEVDNLRDALAATENECIATAQQLVGNTAQLAEMRSTIQNQLRLMSTQERQNNFLQCLRQAAVCKNKHLAEVQAKYMVATLRFINSATGQQWDCQMAEYVYYLRHGDGLSQSVPADEMVYIRNQVQQLLNGSEINPEVKALGIMNSTDESLQPYHAALDNGQYIPRIAYHNEESGNANGAPQICH
eukprot:TRINITY_DN4562_c0_g1_i5.p1 TRINITY_DN4562_c0_g1~~TRINITY_DN4562_c0_g1_i5.p1  ORF type:complete len:457 (+),score=109.35 TRINITY_DN4562_c0_g1_i5:155-1525(+)